MNPLSPSTKKHMLFLTALVGVTVIVWRSAFSAEFLSWDDTTYTINNADIYSFHISNVCNWFSKFYVGNYHPLTMVSFALDYAMGAGNPTIYHVSSLFLHCVNACLVYVVVLRLSDNSRTAALTSLLFALHPVQVESVTWVAERKTLLSGTFSLLAIATYIQHLKKGRNLVMVYVWCLAAMLSKGTAVVLPFMLLAVDGWLTSTPTRKAIQNKLPIFLLSVIFAIIAVKAQSSGGFISGSHESSLMTRAVFAGAALIMYMVHLVAPINLSAIYPYPIDISAIHLIGAAAAVSLLALAFILLRKGYRQTAIGILFFIVTLSPVLQIVRFGEALLADRYLYLACIGLFYPFASIISRIKWFSRPVMYGTAGITLCLLGYLTLERNKNWINDDQFFNALLREHPRSAVALFSVGTIHMRNGDYDAAELLMQRAVENEPYNYKAWYNKGVLHLKQRKMHEAINALNKCISLANYPKAYLQRSLVYQQAGEDEKAIADARYVLQIEPYNARAWYILATGLEKTNQKDSALKCYERAILYSVNEPSFYIGHALALENAGRKQEAILDLEKATEMAPNNPDAHYYLGLLQYKTGISPCRELQSAAALGLVRARQALSRLCH